MRKKQQASVRKASRKTKAGQMRFRTARVKKAAQKAPHKAPQRVRPVPLGYHTITPHIVLDDCAAAIEFYKRALGARERGRMAGPDGKIAHAEIRIGDSIVMLNDEMPSMPGQPGVYKSPRKAGLVTGALFLYVRDVDAVFDRAVEAGCTVRQRPTDMFWGDRYSQVIDPYGHTWAFATRLENLTQRQIEARQRQALASIPGGSVA
jgi:PhnB protein